MTTTIETVLARNAAHVESVQPGQPVRFTEASTAGDAFWQGDLCIGIVDKIPEDYIRVTSPQEMDAQLVLGNTVGARHCLDSLQGVELYRPKEWGGESLRGPAFILHEARTVMHPKHGDVTIPAGFIVLTGYQREYDAEQRRERRARD